MLPVPSGILFGASEFGVPECRMTDQKEMKILMVQIAANVVFQISQMDVRGDKYVPTHGIGQLVSAFANWDATEVLNGLQSQVAFLYGAIDVLITLPPWAVWTRSEAELVAKALSDYQVYKTRLLAAKVKEQGLDLEKKSAFAQATWDDKNESFLALFK